MDNKELLPPWTEVKAETTDYEVEVDMWGRSYRFSHAMLPTSIVSAEEEILSSPIRLAGIVNGEPVTWQSKDVFLLCSNKSEAIVSGCQANDNLIIDVTSKFEFDGMIRMDMVIMPQRERSSKREASPQIERLWLEVPFNKHRATLFHYWPGGWGHAKNSGAIPENGLTLPFKPFIWIGWEEGGLSWFAESDKGWEPKEENYCIEIVREGEEVILRLHLLDKQPRKLPLTLTMGLQATPVKPMPKDFHQWRIYHGANYGIENQAINQEEDETVLDHITELGVKTLVSYENWTPIQGYWKTTEESKLRHLVSECHKRGIKVLLYFGYELSTLAPEWGKMADDVLVKGVNGEFAGGYQRLPEQRAYIVCYNSRWQDYFIEGISRALEDYGFDGVYLDGTIEPWGCANERHGCGYRTLDGSLKATYPIFAVRELMKRLYTIIQSKGGIVNAHQSTCCVTPTLAFCHSYWDGEQFQGGELATEALQKLPLDTFRAEFMGKNFGIPCEFLVYEKPPDWTFERALAFTLLHDVLVRPLNLEELELMSKIWKAMTDFGVSTAEWYPYWENERFLKLEPDYIKASFYQKKDKLLLVVSNLSDKQEVEGKVILDTTALKISGNLRLCYDAITGENIPIKDSGVQISLQPMTARLIQIE